MNAKSSRIIGIAALLAVMCVMFWKSFLPQYVHFSNDGPLGAVSAEQLALPGGILGIWQDTNWVGGWNGSFTPVPSCLFLWVLGPVYFAKFYQFLSCLLLGAATWFCLRRLKLNPAVAIIGGLAAALNGDFFSYACWGLGSLPLSVAFFILGIAAIGAGTGKHLLVRLVLAGLAIGMSVMEGYDNGAIFSLFLAAYVVWTFLINGSQAPGRSFSKGVGAVAIVAICAGLMASSAMYGLISTQVKGVALFDDQNQTPDQQEKAERAQWEFATQWSLPKVETVRMLISGLFGYRMDSPDGRAYWGAVGQSAAWDVFFAQPDRRPENVPQAMTRFSGAGFYAGVPVCLIALWAVLASFVRGGKTFTATERKLIWFWLAMALLSLVLSWGRHAPFYKLFYQLPYFSSIRNPIKFLHPLSFSLIFLFAYGLQGLWRTYLNDEKSKALPLKACLSKWWNSATAFDRRWMIGSVAFLVAGVLAVVLYAKFKPQVIGYLQLVGFGQNPQLAMDIFSGSVNEALWGVIFLALTLGTLGLIICGYFKGQRARWGLIALGAILAIDLMRANAPWVVHYDYQQRYAETPLYEFLGTKPYEHRVSAAMPLINAQFEWLQPRVKDRQTVSSLAGMINQFMGEYGAQWKQHQFPYYNIQNLDIIQEPRASIENTRYREALAQGGIQSYIRMLRLTNTRYLLALGDPFLPPLNELKGAAPGEFRAVMYLGMEQRGEFVAPTVDTNSPLALIEYTGVLPRAKLYSNWEVVGDDTAVLARLANLAFDPASTVIVSDAIQPSAAGTNAVPGEVVIESYAPKHIVLKAAAATRSVLLLNDKFDPHWQVLVDGQPAELLRCNFLMRGVQLEPGAHTVEFHFRPPLLGLYVSIVSIVVGIGLCGWLGVTTRKETEAV